MNLHLPSSVKYREDINGLRAWAVIAVSFFHFSLIGLSGGFTGVDVFFVISGYLMTSIIVGGYLEGNFSILKFYMSRVRRILPPLLIVIIILLILGWFWLTTPDYQDLAKQATFATTFLSNVYYWKNAGYFDITAQEKLLLHTWSLSVEAQFYFLYPLFIAIVWKIWKNIKAISYAVILLFLVSLILNLYASSRMPDASFYLLLTRAWELASGGLIFLAVKNNLFSKSIKNIAYYLGWALIIASFIFISENLSWPSYWAILPVLGTSLVILANNENSIFTNNKIAQWLGDRSYSLYLWHWPIVVILYFTGLQSEWNYVIIGFVLSLLLAHLSYHLIEIPTRKYLTQANLKKEIFVILISCILIGLVSFCIKKFTFEGRLPEIIELVANETNNKLDISKYCSNSKTNNGCEIGDKNFISAILIGDSQAETLISPLLKNTKGNILLFSLHGCGTIKNMGLRHLPKDSEECIVFNNNLIQKINLISFDIPVIIVNRYALYLKGYLPNENEKYISRPGPKALFINNNQFDVSKENFEQIFYENYKDTISEISNNRKIFLVRPYPEMEMNIPKKLSRALIFKNEYEDVRISKENYINRNKEIWEMQDRIANKYDNVNILNPLIYLCSNNYCNGLKNKRPLYYDDTHLSEYGNQLLVPMFEEIFKN